MADISDESLDIYKLAYKSAAAGIAVADIQGKLYNVNPAFLEMWGYEDEGEVIDRPASEFHPDQEKANAVATEVVENGEWEGELLAERKDETTFPVHVSASRVTNESGEPVYIMSSFVDISERVARERELTSKTRALEAAPIGIVMSDVQQEDNPLTYVNERFEEMTGYDAEEIIGRNCRFLQGEQTDEEPVSKMRDAIDAGESVTVELRNYRKDGEQFWNRVSIAPVRTENGLSHFVGFQQDITERKEYEQTLENQRNNLNALNKIVRHDIRNDLQVMLTYTELLEEYVEEGGEEYLQNIVKAGREAVKITQTAGEVTEVMLRSESDQSPVNLQSVLETQINHVRTTHEHVLVRTDGVLPDVQVRADKMLNSVFRNLLNNAIVHNDKEVPKVTVSATIHKDKVQVRIEDNGPRIPDDQKDLIFEEGEKGLDSEGTGLGLYLVQTLVDHYGGTVWIEDNDPEGSVFIVELCCVK